jgi:hypothetical protein
MRRLSEPQNQSGNEEQNDNDDKCGEGQNYDHKGGRI